MGDDNWVTNTGRMDSNLSSGHIQVDMSSRLLIDGYRAVVLSPDFTSESPGRHLKICGHYPDH